MIFSRYYGAVTDKIVCFLCEQEVLCNSLKQSLQRCRKRTVASTQSIVLYDDQFTKVNFFSSMAIHVVNFEYYVVDLMKFLVSCV